jgi:bacterioferritin-associated ferredoxin
VYVCLCVALTDRVVRAAVADGATTMNDLEQRFDAGAVCGGCIEELRSVLAEALATHGVDPVPDVPGRGEN